MKNRVIKYTDKQIIDELLDFGNSDTRNQSYYCRWMTLFKNNEISEEQFCTIIKVVNDFGILLPSGFYGNMLALAFEKHEWDIAIWMIRNTDIDINMVISELDYKNSISAVDYLRQLEIDDLEEQAKVDEVLEEVRYKKRKLEEQEKINKYGGLEAYNEIIEKYGSIGQYEFYLSHGINSRKCRR